MTVPAEPPASDGSLRIDRDALDAAVTRYRRIERAAGWSLALAVAGGFLAAIAALSFWPGVAVGVVLLAALRLPAYRRSGSSRLRTDAPPETVVREFASARPPVLAFQWGIADAVRVSGDGSAGPDRSTETRATYELSYLLGLRSVAIDLETEVRAAEDGDGDDAVATVAIDGTVDGRPWGSYAATVRAAADGGSVVDVELRPTRRFGLRRLPQGWVAGRYYADALAAQGYEVVERTVSLSR